MAANTDLDWRSGILPGLREAPTSQLIFFVAIPLVTALVFAVVRSGMAALMPFPEGWLFWSALMLPAWAAMALMAAITHRVLRPWSPPLWLICIVSSISQAIVFSPLYRAFHRWAAAALVTASGQAYGDWPLPNLSLEYAGYLLWALAPGAAVWMSVNYFYDRVLGVPRYRYDPNAMPGDVEAAAPGAATELTDPAPPPVDVAPSAERSLLLRSSRLPATAEIWALSAEEHYVCLHAEAGNDLVRYRFSDALEEFAATPGGMQVHRSWWVRLDRVRRWQARGRSCQLELANGLRVPVSLAFREAVLARLPAELLGEARRGTARPVADGRLVRVTPGSPGVPTGRMGGVSSQS